MHMMIYLNKLVADGYIAFSEIVMLTTDSSTIIINGMVLKFIRQEHKGVKNVLFLLNKDNAVVAMGNTKIIKSLKTARNTISN